MKKIKLLLLFLVISCKLKVDYPPVYEELKIAFEKQEYEKVIDLLPNAKIKQSQKTDWYYYFYGVSLYENSKRYTRKAIENLKIAITFSDEISDYYFYIGRMYFDIADYKNAKESFEKGLLFHKKHETTKNINLWMALTLLEMGDFASDDFKMHYSITESPYLETFCNQLLTNQISEDFIKDITKTDYLSLDEKILILEVLLHKSSETKIICENMLIDTSDTNLRKYFYSKLVFYNLENLELSKNLLQNFSVEISDDIFILECDSFYIWQIFNKYLCFYYLKKHEYKNAVNALQSYQIYKYKPEKHEHLDTEDIQLIFKEFSRDEDFKSISF